MNKASGNELNDEPEMFFFFFISVFPFSKMNPL